MIRSEVVQFQCLAPYIQGVIVGECNGGQRTLGIIGPGQDGCCFFVGDDRRVTRVHICHADVIAMGVAVDHVGDRLVGHFLNGLEHIRTDGWRSIHHNDPFAGGEEHHLVGSLRHPVEAIADLLDQVAFLEVNGGAIGRCGNWRCGRGGRNGHTGAEN